MDDSKNQIYRNQEIENARLGYEVATNLWIYEGQSTWAAFNAMVVANSVILATEGIFHQGLISLLLPILGIILCVTWLALTTRGFEVHNYRVLSARELEEKYLSSEIKTVSRGAAFHEGKEIILRINGNDKKMQLSRWARLMKGKHLSVVVIFSFGFLHLFSLILKLIDC